MYTDARVHGYGCRGCRGCPAFPEVLPNMGLGLNPDEEKTTCRVFQAVHSDAEAFP